ncbi:MAG: helix-turn-helix domain-containing protein [Lachnospiraceae bacterium]|nr:helix-turn-helix domain-containing protein [Lachnospiraceae bacterium]
MNPSELFELTREEQEKYAIQPDMIPYYDRFLEGNMEFSKYIKGSTMRFWYNTQTKSYPSHWHTALEIVMPLQNHYTVFFQQQEYILQPGDILVIPAGFIHGEKPPATGSRFIFIFELDFFSQITGFNFVLSLLSHPMHITYDDNPELYTAEAKLMMEIARHYWGTSVTKEMNIYSCLISFFAKIGEYATSTVTPAVNTSIKSSSLVTRLSMVLDYIDNHYSENLTLEEAASIACFSKFYFTRLFKQYTNQTFYDYLSAKRIKAAEQMLIVPNLPITEISLKSGFTSLSSFNRTFKRIKGCSPSEYRVLCQKNISEE